MTFEGFMNNFLKKKKDQNCYFQFLRIFGFVLVLQSLCFSYSHFFPLVLSSSYPKIEISLTPCLFPVPSLDSDKSNNVSFFSTFEAIIQKNSSHI